MTDFTAICEDKNGTYALDFNYGHPLLGRRFSLVVQRRSSGNERDMEWYEMQFLCRLGPDAEIIQDVEGIK